ncbi:hypothetical protein [Aquamicrobium terrae]
MIGFLEPRLTKRRTVSSRRGYRYGTGFFRRFFRLVEFCFQIVSGGIFFVQAPFFVSVARRGRWPRNAAAPILCGRAGPRPKIRGRVSL